MTLVKKSPISITVSRSGFDAFMAMRSRVINAKLGQLTIAALLLHRSTLHCYSAPWQTATP